MDDPRTRVTLMNMMTVNATSARSTGAVADARDAARAFLEGLRQPAVAPDAADTVVLVVSELVTNALPPRRGHLHIGTDRAPRHHRGGRPRPQPACAAHAHPDLNGGTGGFGWPMVNRLARATAVTRRASGGKTVSAHLAW